MRMKKTRATDSTFDLNLAPFLDIIVSIVPMLLLSIAFVQVKMIEAPTPQIVSKDQIKNPPKPQTTVSLSVSTARGLEFVVTNPNGKMQRMKIQNKNGQFDMNGLLASAEQIKIEHPDVTQLQLNPDSDVSFDKIVQIMDQVRQKPTPQVKASFGDTPVAVNTQALQLFPDVVFGNVGG